MDIKKLKTFVVLMNNEYDFDEASLNTTLTSIGVRKQIYSLEKELGVKLFENKKGKLKPTNHANLLLQKAKPIIKKCEDMVLSMETNPLHKKGDIFIESTIAIASNWLLDKIKTFQDYCPNKTIHINAHDKTPSFFIDNVDFYIGAKQEDESDVLMQIPILTHKFGLFASHEYIKNHGLPSTPKELQQHKIIAYGSENLPYKGIDWHTKINETILHPKLNINLGVGILHAIEKGFGIGVISEYAYKNSKSNLVQVLPELYSKEVDLYCVFPKAFQTDETISLLLNAIKSE